MFVGGAIGEPGVFERAAHVDRVGRDQHLPARRAQYHRHVPERVSGRVDRAHAAVAEDVERAREARERLGSPGALEVEQPVVEAVVELALDVAVELAVLGSGRPLRSADEERRAGVLRDRAGVVDVQVRHQHDLDVRGLDAALAQLRRGRLVGGHLDALEGDLREAAEVRRRVGGDRGVEAGVDQDRPGAGVLHQEGRHRHVEPVLALDAEPERAPPGEPALLAQEPRLGPDHLAGEQRLQLDASALAPAGERQLSWPGLGCGRHPARP